MESLIETLARESERLRLVREYIAKRYNSGKYEFINMEELCFLLGIELVESEDNE